MLTAMDDTTVLFVFRTKKIMVLAALQSALLRLKLRFAKSVGELTLIKDVTAEVTVTGETLLMDGVNAYDDRCARCKKEICEKCDTSSLVAPPPSLPLR